MRNTHPVMATCLSHRLHMVSKRKRFFVYYMLIALHMTFSVRRLRAFSLAYLRAADVSAGRQTVRQEG